MTGTYPGNLPRCHTFSFRPSQLLFLLRGPRDMGWQVPCASICFRSRSGSRIQGRDRRGRRRGGRHLLLLSVGKGAAGDMVVGIAVDMCIATVGITIEICIPAVSSSGGVAIAAAKRQVRNVGGCEPVTRQQGPSVWESELIVGALAAASVGGAGRRALTASGGLARRRALHPSLHAL